MKTFKFQHYKTLEFKEVEAMNYSELGYMLRDGYRLFTITK